MASISDSADMILKDLSSAKFEVACDEKFRNLIFLRKRSHHVTLSIVGHAAYFAAMLSEMKRRIATTNMSKLDRLRVGIIGFGRLGKHIVNALLRFSKIQPQDIIISTRRPECVLGEAPELGVKVCFDNQLVVKSVDLAFLCCLPVDVDAVLESISGHVSCILYSIVAGISRQKLCQLLNYNAVVKPEYTYLDREACESCQWTFEANVCDSLNIARICERTCPLKEDGPEEIVSVKEFFIAALMTSGVSLCLATGVDMQVAVRLVGEVVFGAAPQLPNDGLASIFSTCLNRSGMVDFTRAYSANDSITRLVLSHPSLRCSCRKKYMAIFNKFAEHIPYGASEADN